MLLAFWAPNPRFVSHEEDKNHTLQEGQNGKNIATVIKEKVVFEHIGKPSYLIIRLLFEFASDSLILFVKTQ